MLVAHSFKSCGSAPLMQYKNNPIYQKTTNEDKFTDNTRDNRIYIDMRRSKGYTDESEKINSDDSSIALTISLNEAATRSRILVLIIKQGLYYVIQKLNIANADSF